jgi:hypothetical protein
MENRKYNTQNNKKYYPKKQDTNNNQVPSITKPFAFDNRVRYQKGHQNQLLNASRKTQPRQ